MLKEEGRGEGSVYLSFSSLSLWCCVGPVVSTALYDLLMLLCGQKREGE